MKKILLSVLAVAVAANMMADGLDFHYSIEAGYDYQKAYEKLKGGHSLTKEQREDAAPYGFQDMHGFHVGGMVEMDFTGVTPAQHIIGLEYGLNYQFLGHEYYLTKDGKDEKKEIVDRLKDMGGKNIRVSNFSHQHALQIPIHFKYTYQINDSWSVFGYTGPQLKFVVAQSLDEIVTCKIDGEKYGEHISENLITGKIKYTAWEEGEKESESEDIDKDLRNSCFDMTWGFGFGAGYKDFSLNLNYNIGMINRQSKDMKEALDAFRQDVLSVTFAYRFK